MRRQFALLIVLACGALAAAQAVAQQEVSLSTQLARLFAMADASTPQAVAAAKAQHGTLQQQAGGDVRVEYGYGLVLVAQHRYAEAIPHLAAYLADKPGDLTAQRIKIWVQLQTRAYTDALDAMAALAGQLPRDGYREPRNSDVARFLGTAFGFLAVVLSEGRIADRAVEVRGEIIQQLGTGYLSALDEGWRAVQTKQLDLNQERAQLLAEAESDAERQIEADRAKIEASGDIVRNEETLMQSSVEQVREAQRAIAVVRRQLDSLAYDRAILQGQTLTAQSQLDEILEPRVIAIGAQDSPRLKTTASLVPFNPLDPRYAQAQALALAITGWSKQVFEIDRQIMELRGKAAQLAAKGAEELDALAESEENIADTERHARALEKKIQRAQPKPSPRATLLANQIKSLSTYLPFDFEQESARVLSWFDE